MTVLPLSGIRVLDITTVVYGPYATQVLGDFGADVIKIERPGGDQTRLVGPKRNPGMGALFLGINRNKRSIALDLKRQEAKRALWRLIDGADMLVHNMRPKKMAALGFDPDSVLKAKPDIIYGGLHGYREEGPFGGRPAYDDVIQAESGIAGTFTARDGSPVLIPTVVADKTAALLAANGLLAALFQRTRTGKGVYVETAMFEALVGFTLVEHHFGAMFAPPEGPPGYNRALSPERKPYATADGHICMLPYTDKQFERFWALVGRPDYQDDPRFATMADRARHIDELYAIAGGLLTERSSEEWLALLREAEIPCGPFNRLDDLRANEQLSATEFFRPFAHPSEGDMEMPDTAFRFDREALPVRRHAPGLGEHSREVLREAGFSEAEIDEVL